MNGFYRKERLVFTIVFTSLVMAIIICSYAILSVTPIPDPAVTAVHLERGSILDRNGKILAIQNYVYNIVVTPEAVTDKEAFSEALSPAVDMTKEQILADLKAAPATFFYLKKKISQSEHDDIRAIIKSNKLNGIRLEKVTSRAYPESRLAAHIIGFMGDSGKGFSGLEYSYQKTLAPPEPPDFFNGRDLYGKSVVTTIDASLQHKLEQTALNSFEKTQAESFMLIAAEAKTGEILSYISLPAPNLNFYPQSTIDEKMDRPAITAYEPGSAFKVFSVASFIDSGAIKPQDSFFCSGGFEIKTASGEISRIKCLGKHGWVTAREALQYSCNDAIAQMSQLINSETFINRIKAFGFGSKTGIELPGETRGSVKSVTDRLWSPRSKPTISIGQEISVSALQMVQAATALANGGVPVKLTLTSKIIDRGGNIDYSHAPEYGERVLSATTAEYLLSCMETTARYGSGSRAAINDITIGVKTGTAQMINPLTGKYSDTDFLSNCIAVFPVENPRIILYIVITKAKGETYAGRIVAPVIAEAADIIIDYLGLARERALALTHSGTVTIPRTGSAEIKSVVPDFTGLPKRALLPLLERKDIVFKILGDGWVVSQTPPPGTPVTENMPIELILQ